MLNGGGELFTCSEGGDGESAEEGSGVVTIGAAFRAPQSMYVLIQNRGKTRTKSALRRKMSQGCSPTWVAQSKRRLSRRRFRRVSLTPTEATATAVSSPKEEREEREEREEGVREEECAVRLRAARPQGARTPRRVAWRILSCQATTCAQWLTDEILCAN